MRSRRAPAPEPAPSKQEAMPAPPPPPAPAPARTGPRLEPTPLGRMQDGATSNFVAPKSAAGGKALADQSGDLSEEETLDRIEVTGSRIKRADVEVVSEFESFEQGVEQVRALLEAGRRDEARERLQALRKQFPRERLPADFTAATS